MTTASDMIDLLRAHYLPENRPAGGLFAPEIASPNGKRRADLIWVPTTIAGSHADCIVGHEVKVSRSDVIAELADPTKADPWARYCTRWWLVVSEPRLIEGLDIPAAWGVMAPPSGRRRRSMTILRQAPRLTPSDNLAPAVTRLSAYMVGRVESQVSELRRSRDWIESSRNDLERQVEDMRLNRDFGAQSPHAKRLNKILSEVSKRSRSEWWVRENTDEDVIEALVDVARLQGAVRGLRDQIDRSVSALGVDPFKAARERLQVIAADIPEIEVAS